MIIITLSKVIKHKCVDNWPQALYKSFDIGHVNVDKSIFSDLFANVQWVTLKQL